MSAVLPGQRWKYVYPDGREVEYVVDKAESEIYPDEQGYQHVVWLLNPVTGKHATQYVGTLFGHWKGDPAKWERVDA